MDDPQKHPSQPSESEYPLPDVVHSQQGSVVETAVALETEVSETDSNRISKDESPSQNAVETSETESVSEHVPFKVDYSTESDQNANNQYKKQDENEEKVSKHLNIPQTLSLISDNTSTNDPGPAGTSWPLDSPAEGNLISEESPVYLAVSSDLSKDGTQSQSVVKSSHTNLNSREPSPETLKESLDKEGSDKGDGSEYEDSLNEETTNVSNSISIGAESVESSQSVNLDKSQKSSSSEEIIKLDIRGQGAPKFSIPTAKIIFGPPPEGSNIIDPTEQIPAFQNLLSPYLIGAGDSIQVEEIFNFDANVKDFSYEADDRDPSLFQSKEATPDQTRDFPYQVVEFEETYPDTKEPSPESDKSLLSDREQDVLVEEVTVDYDTRQREFDDTSIPTQPKSFAPEDISFTTTTTDYKTICVDYQVKLVHLEEALTQRDDLIEELTISLQRSVQERDELQKENIHLSHEVQNLQQLVVEHSNSDHETVKGQISDFMQYEKFKDDSTKFYSAVMSGSSSSNGEKDNDREEITVNYSRSDLKSEGSNDEFQTGFEMKLTTIIDEFDEHIEENLRNKLRESIIQVLCDEIGKIRLESDTDIKELESQMQQDKQAFTKELAKLRELVASVKSGHADIDALREEMGNIHEKEMENLRTYFEKKCSDMERSYSEEVWRGKTCASPAGSQTSDADACGDCPRRRARSADLPSLSIEPSQLEQALKLANKKLEDTKAEHLIYVSQLQKNHREAVTALEEQITELKAHIQTAENTEVNVSVSVYQQDIDLELEKQAADFDARLEAVRQDVVHELQDQIKVLLSDPDAEVTSWPLELVALRDKIQGDARAHTDRELSSLREELCGETDKWKQKRNCSFDQNRQLEEVTKERDGLRRVAAVLQRCVSQLVAYCACAEDELNRTVLAKLLQRLDTSSLDVEDSRLSTPNLSIELNTSAVSRASKHVHFAPDLQSILAELDEDGLVGFLQEQRDISLDIKKELEHSLRRLRHEAHELLDLSNKLGTKAPSENMLEAPAVQITELVDKMDAKADSCHNCQIHKKTMEEAMSECIQRETLLRADLDAAMLRIAGFMTEQRNSDLIAEGYGTVPPMLRPVSLPGRSPRRPDSGPMSLDGCSSPRAHLHRMAHDLDHVIRERDDLQQQLEAANRQLRSTRQFVEEQATERESERDEFARRLADLREENQRLAARLQTNARILSEVEQLESQTREMTQIISELESRKQTADDQIKSTEEKVAILNDIISNLESQLEQKTSNEIEILQQLEVMKQTIDERDSKMRVVISELESLRSERVDSSEVMCVRCGQEEDRFIQLQEKIREQCLQLEDHIDHRTRRLERMHEVCSAPCSEPSEDVSKRDQRNNQPELTSASPSPRVQPMAELVGVWGCLQSLSRAEDAALKRLADMEMQRNQLKDIAQEVRAERDVLQSRMSEQALKISSLSARLQQQRNDAEALAHSAHSQLSVRLHDALAEVQRLHEELESKDKQLVRVRQNLEEREKLSDKHQTLYGNSCNPKDKVIILERELSSAQNLIAQLETQVRALESDKDALKSALSRHQKVLAEREEQLQELLALKLDEDDNQKDDKSEILDGNKTSARTLSDIVSISEYDEQDLQMRRAELKNNNLNLTDAPFDTNKVDVTNTPDIQRANMSSLNIDLGDHFETINSPRADSLPTHLTSTQNKDAFKEFKRTINETTIFGTAEKGDSQKIPDNCSLYPNRDISDSKNVSVEPKKIDFSLEASNDNKTNDEEHISLKDLGITLDLKQENFPDILTQLKSEIKRSRMEVQKCKSELKNAEEQLCEFPALKEEVEELKGLLENTMGAMENDKKFYENQLDNFMSNKKLLEQRMTELAQEVSDKSKDLHLLKEDILRRENMVLELAKEKRNLTNKLTELEVKIDELQSRNNVLEKYESENHHLREKVPELQRLDQLLSEKNHQIDSLNQHLDRLDDLQRCLNDKTDELDNLKEAFEEKSNELFRLQDLVETMTQNIAQLNEDNKSLNDANKELKQKLSKAEKEQENASMKLQSSESEIERVTALNNELTSKIEELKQLSERLKDKEADIEILNEDINAFHEEIATLKEQLKMVSRSPSPRRKEEKPSRRTTCDSKELTRIRKQVSLLQHELDFNKKELNDKVFELSKAKLDVTELKNNLGQAAKLAIDKDNTCKQLVQANEDLKKDLEKLVEEKQRMREQLESVVARIREEGNIEELKAKLREKTDKCIDLENEVQDLKELVERLRSLQPVNPSDERALVVSGTRSPTAELERALRDQLNYSHTLDEDIMEQILSGSSDDREDVPRLALNLSSKSSSIHSSTSERLHRTKAENEKLQLQVSSLEARLRDKDALITELNRIRDKLEQDCQSLTSKYECERDTAGRLQLLLDTQKQTAESLQNQDTNMINILKKRLEAAMKSELELQHKEQQSRNRAAQLERQLLGRDDASKGQLQHELENVERLRSEISLLKSRLEVERTRYGDLQALFDHSKLQYQRDIDVKNDACQALRNELAEIKRQKKDLSAELVRAKELSRAQSAAIAQLEHKMAASPRPLKHALSELETHKSELSRELATLKRCISSTLESSPEVSSLRADRQRLQARVEELERGSSSQDRDQAIRYLQGRNLRLESCRKALVWQKRYLQRVLAGYEKMETRLKLTHPAPAPEPASPLRRFKCVAVAVLAFLRMNFLVRRRQHVRSISANCLLRPRDNAALNSTTHLSVSTSPPTRDRPKADALARRVLNPDLRLHMPASSAGGDYNHPRSPYANSPRDEPFVLSTPRSEVAAAYLSKLELVSRCLSQAMDASRDNP